MQDPDHGVRGRGVVGLPLQLPPAHSVPGRHLHALPQRLLCRGRKGVHAARARMECVCVCPLGCRVAGAGVAAAAAAPDPSAQLGLGAAGVQERARHWGEGGAPALSRRSGGAPMACLSQARPMHPGPPGRSLQVCGGTVLRCLTEHSSDIQSEDCQKEVFYFEKVRWHDSGLVPLGGGHTRSHVKLWDGVLGLWEGGCGVLCWRGARRGRASQNTCMAMHVLRKHQGMLAVTRAAPAPAPSGQWAWDTARSAQRCCSNSQAHSGLKQARAAARRAHRAWFTLLFLFTHALIACVSHRRWRSATSGMTSSWLPHAAATLMRCARTSSRVRLAAAGAGEGGAACWGLECIV